MKDAARLMVKVFAVVFGAGSAVVVLLYLLLGGYYLYGRMERANQASSQPNPKIFIETYDPKTAPDFLPNAQLDCGSKDSACGVLVDGRLAALISRDEVKSNLAGWMIVNPTANSH